MTHATSPRVELSREGILDAALAIVDREGEAGLTFRRLGAALGADPTACYRHFRSKDDLLLGLADRLFGEALDAVPEGLGWRATLEGLATGVVRGLVAHPRLAVLVTVRTTQGEQEHRAIERVLAALVAAGLPLDEAVAAWLAFADTTLAWAGFQALHATLPDDVRRVEGMWTTSLRLLPSSTHPHIAAARHLLDDDFDSFPAALGLLLDGVAARIPTPHTGA